MTIDSAQLSTGELAYPELWPATALAQLAELAVRSWRAEVDDRVEAIAELIEDRGDAAPTLDGQLNLDRHALAIGEDDPVWKMLTGPPVTGKDTLGDPLRSPRAVLDMKPHVVDGRDVGEQADARRPASKARTASAQACRGREDPGGLTDEQASRMDETVATQAGEDTLHRPLAAAHHELELVDSRGVLLTDPCEQLEVAATEQLAI